MLRVALVTGLLLLVPLVAKQFTDEVRWNLADFVVAGALLFGVSAARSKDRQPNVSRRRRCCGGATRMLVWANLAVGLIGRPRRGWRPKQIYRARARRARG